MFQVDGGYRDRERWDDVHDQLSHLMAQLEHATQPYIEEAQRAADRAMKDAES